MWRIKQINYRYEANNIAKAILSRRYYDSVIIVLVLFIVPGGLTNGDVVRPRGVSLALSHLYYPQEGADKWTCLDNSKTIKFTQINDDYCDCDDGSDEPGTSACPKTYFFCNNAGFRSLDIPSSRVNDGICDCCDGSDEYVSNHCQNICEDLGRIELEKRKIEADLHNRGLVKRNEMISKGKQLRSEREVRRVELERRRNEQNLLKAEKEALKNAAETVEADALEVYKQQQREAETDTSESDRGENDSDSQRLEAESSFLRYDVNEDGFVEVTELQVDMALDRDRNGVVTVEEAKYILDERDRIDLDAFITFSWPRIKAIQMMAEGLFKPPEETAENLCKKGTAEESSDPNCIEEPESHEEHEGDLMDEETDEESPYEDDEDADIGVGSVTEESTQPTQEYDPETQRLVELANEARNAYAQVENEVREIEHEMKEIDDQNQRNYGLHEEYAVLDGECFTFEDREYIYTLCPFDRASQKSRSGGSETTLGRWDQWIEDGNNRKFSKQKYANGASCWNGPQRSVVVRLQCGLENRITAVSEPNRCEYVYDFETPAACDAFDNGNESENIHDEL